MVEVDHGNVAQDVLNEILDDILDETDSSAGKRILKGRDLR